MEFPHSFYEDEVRSDFLIPSMVKRTWAAQIQILADLDEACKKNGLQYYAEWGTLLGTIRHGGFIPWDDDMDVCMRRRDYNFLIDNVSSILPDNYSIVSYRSNRDFKQMLCRIVSSDHYRFDPEYMHKYSGLPIALGIDIFPLDYLTDDEVYERQRKERADLVYGIVNEIGIYNTPVYSLEKYIKEIEQRCRVRIDRKGDVLTQLRSLLEKIFAEVDEKDAKYLTLYPIWLDHPEYKFPVEYYGRGIRLPFENTDIPVPVCYDEILRHKYGGSYMTQVRSGGAHEYPYFETHVDILREHFGFEWPAYRFSKNDLAEPKEGDDTAKGKCLFITYGLREFDNMRSLAKKYLDEGSDVSILPVARYNIAADMTGITADERSWPDEEFLKGLRGAEVVHDPDVLETGFDIIVTNFQYDEYNLITTTDKKFYSKNLRGLCRRLIYVPAHEVLSIKPEDERAIKLMPLYVNTPLAAVCDKIIVHSEEMKDRYVECLSAFSGEEYRSIWENKIKVLEGRSLDKARTGKKKIMFYFGIAIFAQCGVSAMEKIKSVFGIFEENRGKIEVVFKVQAGLCDNLKELDPDLYEKYAACDFRESGEEVNVEDIDAYYGEGSEYATQFLDAKKPVMIMAV